MTEKRRSALKLFYKTAKFASLQESVEHSVVGQLLELDLDEATRLRKRQRWADGAWTLRRCFDKVRKEPESRQLYLEAPKERDSLSQLLGRTIDQGAPMYKKIATSKLVCKSLNHRSLGQLLRKATDEAQELQEKKKWADGAWVLRHLFDEILSDVQWRDIKLSVSSFTEENDQTTDLLSVAATYEKVIEIKDRKYHFKTYHQCFIGSEAVATLVDVNMAENREEAIARLKDLFEADLIRHVTREHPFEDKNLFYRFTYQ